VKKQILPKRIINRNRPLPAITRHRIRALALEMAMELLRENQQPFYPARTPIASNPEHPLPF